MMVCVKLLLINIVLNLEQWMEEEIKLITDTGNKTGGGHPSRKNGKYV